MTESEAIRENYNLGVLAGEAREQQRIIQILTAKTTCKGNEHNYNGYCFCEEIALIKGEAE